MMLARSTSLFTTRILDRAELTTIVPEWQALCERAIEPNVYFAPHYMLPLLQHVEPKSDVRVISVWNENRLVAFFPVINSVGVPGLRPSGKAWQSDYSFTATPLIDGAYLEECALHIVAAMKSLSRGEWLLPTIQHHGAVIKAMCSELDRNTHPYRLLNQFQRAALSSGQDFDTHMAQHVGTSHKKNLAKRRKKLEEKAKVEYRHCQSAAELQEAIDAFLMLEGKGWKGARGTALVNDPGSKAFGIDAFGAKAEGRGRADMLLANGKPIAVILTAICGKTGFTVKNTYDEDFADVSAGLLLEVEFLKNFFSTQWVDQLDSGTNGEHVIDRFWPGRLAMADLLVSFAPAFANQRLNILERRNALIAQVKPKLKKLLKRD